MHGTSSTNNQRGTPSRRGKSPRFSSDGLSQLNSGTLPGNPMSEPGNLIVSCLDIPVQGAFPIDRDCRRNSSVESSQAAHPESKRAPRKSKTEALVALNNQARSSSPGLEDADISEDLTAKFRNAPPIPVSSRLDLSNIKTSTPGIGTPRAPRPFGLADCPEFFPTVEEFKDPMSYIKSISSQAENYGICKIIPPRDWKMPFVTDTENFRFKTRLQRLNNIEASSRAKLNFLEQLYQFHEQQGNSRVVIPTINHKPLDLWLLRKEVHKLGGYDLVTKNKKWSDLGRELGYRGIPGLSTQIKNSYTRVILPFEHYCERGRRSPSEARLVPRDGNQRMHVLEEFEGNFSRLSTTAPSTQEASPRGSPLTARSSPLSEPPDDAESKDRNGKPPTLSLRLRRSSRMGLAESPASKKPLPLPAPLPAPIFYDKQNPDTKMGTPEVRTPNQAGSVTSPTALREQQNCEICHKKNRGEEMLLCDGCDCGFHMFCLDPPLDTIPKEQWFCYTCLAGSGGDFGFDEGEEHSLSSFQARDQEFRRLWFESHPPAEAHTAPRVGDITKQRIGNVFVSEYDVEEEFWRLVQSSNETVEIEYGADVHSTTHGSAMPTMETHPLELYSKDPWNLNNIPILSESLLRFIKSDISGMTVPWTYVGMVFSTFCWHNEDHYTYSINYMHWGETKTWYGIPGADAEKFEAAIRSEAPELFEAQPDLLFQLVTLMNPQRLTEAGVRVYGCNQRAGEFVVTFPKAYHAGFNHGLNFNEAVNFALPDWLPLGRECVQRYREHRKLPVFSHDELLITITQQSATIKTAMWLIESLREMTDRELADRQRARALGMSEFLEQEDRPEDQYQCMVCKAFCYLSQITCQCSTTVVCVDHHDLLCENHGVHHLVLRKRFSDEELTETLSKFAERAGAPSVWQQKLQKLLSESARPGLRPLRALLAEGDRISYSLPEMASLRKCVARANEWLESANSFIIRKTRKRPRRSKGRSTDATDDLGDRPDRGLGDLYALLREVDGLGFDCPEIGALRSLAQQAEEVKGKAAQLLNTPPSEEERQDYLNDCKRLLIEGSSLNVLLDDLLEVEKIVDREQLLSDLEERLDDRDTTVTLDEVRHLLTRARLCILPEDNKYMRMLRARQSQGDDWETRARNILDQPIKTIEELNEFADMDPNIPIDPGVLNRIMTARAKALDFEKQAKTWLACDATEAKARIADVVRLATRASKDFSIYSVQLLRRSADIATDLENRCENVLRNRYLNPDEDVFTSVVKWKVYAKAHLNMFLLPNFQQLEKQVAKHEAWLKTIPWWCAEHNETHSQEVLDDVLENTRPEDDLPPNDEFFTCICSISVRPPSNGAASDAVQCDHCFARFHGDCAKNGGSCPFCDHQHWNGTINKRRNFHFCFLPTVLANAPDISRTYSDDYKKLEIIVHRLDRLSAIIGQFLSYTSHPDNQRSEYLPQVRHYMRKLYKVQFAVSPNPDVSFGLDLAGLHRILACRPPATRNKKRRKPRFVFGQDVDNDWTDGTRCICRGRMTTLDALQKVECELCRNKYHKGCVFLPDSKPTHALPHFTCPICCLRKGKMYPYSDVRVIAAEVLTGEKRPLDVYVDTKQMLEACSRCIIFKQMPPPQAPTLFVELVQFHAGSEGRSSSSASSSRPSFRQPTPYSAPPQAPYIHHGPPLIHHPPPNNSSFHMQSDPAPPPPPWSRWAPMSTPTMPPSTQRRSQNGESSRTNGTIPPTSRKRKHAEELPHQQSIEDDSRASGAYPLKRHAGHSHDPTPVSTPPRPVQTLSPSLAMIVSPTNQAVHSSPRGTQLPPLLRNGSSGSPLLPPVKSLMGGESSRGPPL